MRKFRAIMMREFRDQVKKKSFIIGTILTPVIMAALAFLPSILATSQKDEGATFAFVDVDAGVTDRFLATMTDTFPSGESVYNVIVYKTTESELPELRLTLDELTESDSLDFYLIVDSTIFDDEQAEYHAKSFGSVQRAGRIERWLSRIVIERRLEARGLSEDDADALMASVDLNYSRIGEPEDAQSAKDAFLSEYLGTLLFILIMFGTVFGYGQQLMRVVLEEKSSKVIEILVSSVTPFQLMTGKILGLGAVTILQVSLWILMGIGVFVGFGDVAIVSQSAASISVYFIVMFVVYLILGYFFFSAVFAILGAVVSSEKDAQQFMFPIIMIFMIPIMIQIMIMNNPNALIVKLLSIIPPFSLSIMIARLRVIPPATWEVALSVALLILATLGVAWLAARIFRVGILMYGKRATLPEVMKWIRQK